VLFVVKFLFFFFFLISVVYSCYFMCYRISVNKDVWLRGSEQTTYNRVSN